MPQEQTLSHRIVVSRDVAHGKPRIAGTRILVHHVLGLLAAGKSIAEITSDDYYPDLTEADVLACLTYASRVIEHDTVVPTA
jgi:uncharacterized protein (DUF433 family)